ncbi:hypothetical protein [Ornithinibacillus gellani]|nr:hypothetical protein [Ornithinibacillus gellani]
MNHKSSNKQGRKETRPPKKQQDRALYRGDKKLEGPNRPST